MKLNNVFYFNIKITTFNTLRENTKSLTLTLTFILNEIQKQEEHLNKNQNQVLESLFAIYLLCLISRLVFSSNRAEH